MGSFQIFVLVFVISFSVFWLWQLYQALHIVHDAREMKAFYADHLKIPDSDLGTMEWNMVVERLVKVQSYMKLSVQKKLNAHDITMRVMRKQNYLVALINMNMVNLSIPIPGLRGIQVMTKTLEWNLMQMMDWMFGDEFKLKSSNFLTPAILRRKFILYGFLNLLVAPFLIFFLIVSFIFRYAERFRRSPGKVGNRNWSRFARWMFLEYNELPHLFERRLKKSLSPAKKFVEQYPDYLLSAVASNLIFMVGAVAGVLLIIGLLDEPMLVHLKLGERPLAWYLVVLGTGLALLRSLVADSMSLFEPEKYLGEVCQHIHYRPKLWRMQPHSSQVLAEFKSLFRYRVDNFFQEIASVVVTPLILWFSLTKSADNIVEFMRNSTVKVAGVGNVCQFSNFNFHKYGDSAYGSTSESGRLFHNRHGKMEKSFSTFLINHPQWQPAADSGAHEFLDNMMQFSRHIGETGFSELSALRSMYAESGMGSGLLPDDEEQGGASSSSAPHSQQQQQEQSGGASVPGVGLYQPPRVGASVHFVDGEGQRLRSAPPGGDAVLGAGGRSPLLTREQEKQMERMMEQADFEQLETSATSDGGEHSGEDGSEMEESRNRGLRLDPALVMGRPAGAFAVSPAFLRGAGARPVWSAAHGESGQPSPLFSPHSQSGPTWAEVASRGQPAAARRTLFAGASGSFQQSGSLRNSSDMASSVFEALESFHDSTEDGHLTRFELPK